MKAAQITDYGTKDAVKVVEMDTPKPREGQVLVEVRAASCNPFDWKVRDGVYREFMPVKFPITPGGDLAGIVAEVGPGVENFSVGQEVYGQANALGQGSYAEFAPVKAGQLGLMPETVDYLTAAALPLVCSSAYQAVYEHISLKKGQKILIHGGGGGIGSVAVQLAKHIGAYVATTVSEKDKEYATTLGADEVIDYKAEDFSEKLKDYDAVFDTVGGETADKSYKVLKFGAVMVSMVAQPNEELVKKHRITFVSEQTKVTSEVLGEIARLVDDNVIKINIDKTFPLDQAAEALEYLKTGHPRGKVVIKVKD